MFGLEEAEVISRRRYVSHVRTEIQVSSSCLILAAINDMLLESRICDLSWKPASERRRDLQVRVEVEVYPAHHQQRMTRRNGLAKSNMYLTFTAHATTLLMTAPQMMIRQQDETISTISGTLNTLQEQAGLMGQEIGEHNEYVRDVYFLYYRLILLPLSSGCLTILSKALIRLTQS